jgi:hypothetical protein
MKYVVWHAKDEVMFKGLASKPSFPADYRRVAVVECKNVDLDEESRGCDSH